jgi:hypothetical protein
MTRRWPGPGSHWKTRRAPLRWVLLGETGILASMTAVGLAGAYGARLLPSQRWLPVWMVVIGIVSSVGFGAAMRAWNKARDHAAAVMSGTAAPTAAGALDGERRRVLDRGLALGARSFLGLALPAAAAALFVLALKGRDPAAFVLAGALLLPALVVLVRVAWQGEVEVRWRPETLVPGRRATFFVGTPADGQRLRGASFVLRCVSPPTRRVPSPHLPTVVWSETKVAAADRAPGPDDFLEVTFDLPPDAPPSALDAATPTWWELLVRGRTSWGAVTESFLVPVRASVDS